MTIPLSLAGKQLFPESLENGKFEWVECTGLKPSFFGLQKCFSSLVTLGPFGVVGHAR